MCYLTCFFVGLLTVEMTLRQESLSETVVSRGQIESQLRVGGQICYGLGLVAFDATRVAAE